MSGGWYWLVMPAVTRGERRFQADDDQIAMAMAVGLVKAQIRRQGGAGVAWRLSALVAGPRSQVGRVVAAP